ncbi:MAG: RNA polymerase sigma factor [Solirubrobacteraceae bacterium]
MRCDAGIIHASLVDPAAFAALFDRHWVRIYRYCLRRAGPPGEDLAAETFRVAFDQRHRYDGRDDAAPWLYGIATNLVRGWFRSAARGSGAYARAAAGTTPEALEEDETLDRVEAERLAPDLAAGLANLSATDRDALLLYALADLSYEEIARAIGVPTGTIASRINRARTRVRAHLENLELSR